MLEINGIKYIVTERYLCDDADTYVLEHLTIHDYMGSAFCAKKAVRKDFLMQTVMRCVSVLKRFITVGLSKFDTDHSTIYGGCTNEKHDELPGIVKKEECLCVP